VSRREELDEPVEPEDRDAPDEPARADHDELPEEVAPDEVDDEEPVADPPVVVDTVEEPLDVARAATTAPRPTKATALSAPTTRRARCAG
jgi:hypothetical protein